MKLIGAKIIKKTKTPPNRACLATDLRYRVKVVCCAPSMYLFEEDVVHDDHGGQVGVGAPHHSELRRLSRT